MNTKISKGILGTTLVVLMVTLIFTAMIPTSFALTHTISKETIEGPGGAVNTSLQFNRGDTVYYRYSYTPISEAVWIHKIDDLYPDGTLVNLYTGNISQALNVTHTGETQWVIPNDWANTTINNRVYYYVISQNTGLSDEGTASCQNFVFYNPPEFDFNFTGTDCLEVEFSAWEINDTSILNWTWDFGAGESPLSGTGSFPITVSHTFNSCGSKTVELTACNEDGCPTITHVVNVACGPTAIATYSPSCYEENGTEITFDGSASYGVSTPLRYVWTFTGGFIGDCDNGAVTKVMVDAPITATLTVTDALNCTDTAEVSVRPCPDRVPVFTPFGMMGLVTVLSALALFTITMRRRR